MPDIKKYLVLMAIELSNFANEKLQLNRTGLKGAWWPNVGPDDIMSG